MDDIVFSKKNFDIASKKWLSSKTPEDFKILNFWGRSTVRSLYSAVEGILFTIKNVLIEAYKLGELELTAGEAFVLMEKTFYVRNKKVVTVDKNLRFLDNFHLVTKFYSKLLDIPVPIDKSSEKWQCFKNLKKVRDRITHPKKIESLSISIEEIEWTIEAYRFLLEMLISFHKAIGESK